MEQFSLEKYLANPKRKVVTRDGKPVRIVCTDKKGCEHYPIVALVETDGKEFGRTYTKDGRFACSEVDNDDDLFFVPIKHEGWVNIHQSDGRTWIGDVFSTEIEAKGEGCVCKSYVATIKIEWTE